MEVTREILYKTNLSHVEIEKVRQTAYRAKPFCNYELFSGLNTNGHYCCLFKFDIGLLLRYYETKKIKPHIFKATQRTIKLLSRTYKEVKNVRLNSTTS